MRTVSFLIVLLGLSLFINCSSDDPDKSAGSSIFLTHLSGPGGQGIHELTASSGNLREIFLTDQNIEDFDVANNQIYMMVTSVNEKQIIKSDRNGDVLESVSISSYR